jgi:cystathionine beta-lyase/cystathionine gamma-synthase
LNPKSNDRPRRFATQAVHAGQAPDPTTGATIPPIYLTSTYTQAAPGEHKGYDYARAGSPTRDNLEACLAALEGGAACAAFASGLAGETAILSSLRPGDNVVAYSDLYGGTYRLMERIFRPWGLDARYTNDTAPQAFARLMDRNTKLVWIETPTNPLLRVLDIKAIAEVAHAGGAKLVVDSTFGTPVLQKPMALGADYVVHSTTKYLGGHSDVIGGAVIVRDAALHEPLKFYQLAAGGVPGPFDVYLVHRGIKTLHVRMERHVHNARYLADRLAGHKALERVIYPGLADHPDYQLANRQMCGAGGIVTIVVKGGREKAFEFCKRLRVFALAESLGGVESLCNHPAAMTHASIPKEVREARGVTDGLLRLSVGIEDADDLLEDVWQALG